ncbi:aminopeptidase C [Parvimonas sp. C2]|uniref:aminopeptidase C n=1 Tax=Parvimonas sp. C2 TaxID=3110692 RepID=UPI002B45CD8C|nr:C1 family peptidase [Parvimonas sp. C2]MEB3072415.1 C1 family peptidase [Parvimonas sp. C2]
MVTNEMMKKFKKRFESDLSSRVISNAIAKNGIQDSSINNDALRFHNFKFSDSVKKAEITNQKKSGRCWMFSGLNVLRLKVMEKLNLKTFEFSQVYLFFMDKMEKSNNFLELMIEHIDEPLGSRLMDSLLDLGADDGNFFECFDDLISKHGIVPKSVMPETFSSSDSGAFVEQINVRLKRTAMNMRKAHSNGASVKELKKLKEETLYEVYNICTKVLGKLPETFDFEYTDKDDKFQKITNLTPKKFYKEYVGDYFENKVDLIEDPRGKYPFGKRIELKYFKSVREGNPVASLNVPQEEIKKAIIASIKAGEAVWFACDVMKNCDRKLGIMDKDLFNYDETLTELGEFSKADRIDYRYTDLTHAMTFVGVDLDENGNPIKWQVENSWGDEVGEKGIFSMSDSWFTNENISAIVDKKFVDEKWLKGLEEESIKIEPWEPYAMMLKR